MRYELHIPGNPPARFETEHDLREAASHAVMQDRNARIHVIDLAAGQTALFTDQRTSHEEYKKRFSLQEPISSSPDKTAATHPATAGS